MACVLAVLALAGRALGEDSLVERWDKPKRESFEMKLAWPESVAEALVERYGVPFELAPVSLERADFVAKDVTFFEALDRFAAVHGLGVVGVPGVKAVEWGPRPLTLVRPEEGTRVVKAAYIGPTRLSVRSVSVLAVVPCAPPEAETRPWRGDRPEVPRLRLLFRWIAEPGFDGISLVACEVTAAEDDLGQRLRLTEGLEQPVPAGEDFAITFEPPSPKARSIKKLEGKVRVALPVEKGKVEFLAGDVGKTKALGAAQVTLDGIDAETNTVSFTVKGAPCAGANAKADVDLRVGSEDWFHATDVNAVAMLPYDGEGNEIAMGSRMESTTDETKSTFKIELEAVPSRLTLEAFVRGIERDAPFAFADIPLPE